MSFKYFFRKKQWYLGILLVIISCSVKVDKDKTKDQRWKNRLNNHTDWGIYRGHSTGIQYSELDQIHTGNVQNLEKAWEYHHGNPIGPGMYANPIIIDGILYFTTPEVNAVALNAATGEEIWVFRPHEFTNDAIPFRGRNRGLTYWEDANGENKRILNFVKDRVYAIDAKTGKLIISFGENGWIDLRKNLPQDPNRLILKPQVKEWSTKTSSLSGAELPKKILRHREMFVGMMR
jgi:quinoprotein glucose dehydrogenase